MESKLKTYRFPIILIIFIIIGAIIRFGAYFASLIGEFGSDLIGDYVKVVIMHYPVALLYFVIGFTLYGLPIEALPIITTIGVLVDPPAKLINVTGDTVSSMLVTRNLEGKGWLETAKK